MSRSIFVRIKNSNQDWDRFVEVDGSILVSGFPSNTVLEIDIGDGVIREHTTAMENSSPAVVSISQITESGSILDGPPSTFSGHPTPTVSFRWYDGQELIAGASSRSYNHSGVFGEYSREDIATNGVGSPATARTNTIIVSEEEVITEPVTGAIWVGQTEFNQVTVNASLIEGATEVAFVATPVGGTANDEIRSSNVSVDPSYKFARTSLNLSPGTEYDIRVKTASNHETLIPNGKFRTPSQTRQPCSVGFASCGSGSRNDAIYDTIIDQNPDLIAFYHLGDRGYPDISTNDVSLYHNNDSSLMSKTRISRFHRSFPVIYTWDDHDYANNNSTSASAAKPAALGWYRSRVPMKPRSSVTTDTVTFSHFPVAGVEVVMLDVRSARSPGQIISPSDEQYLISRIQATGETSDGILLFNSGVPWIAGSSGDTWSDASAQRTRIANAITSYGNNRVAIIGGDAHMLAFDNGTNSAGRAPVFHAAPLAQSNSTKGGPYSGGTVVASQNQYGRLDFTPVVGGWTVRYRGYSVDSSGIQTLRLEHTANLL